MKIEVVAYNPEWPVIFNHIKNDLKTILGELNPKIEHVGSTSVPNLAAKPIIDIAVGIDSADDLDRTVEPMIQNRYIYYETYNAMMPYRRFFVGLKNKEDHVKFKNVYTQDDPIPHESIHLNKQCHVHIWEFKSPEWHRHIAFRDYLLEHPEVRKQYEALKKALSLNNWKDGNEYNDGKNSFIKREEEKAVKWWRDKKI
ncbi:GrpB family protein [Sinomicrobium weinanense]|uniref:GrpB family protein n=1 Tax=Sinomicrobium weinanense TaxID=2842200 RepID=A0A926JPE1_9FLAO|nr:GrpB family protein [Sinomicrobium weinanense]MBC9794879.1 GrpB family protein [Sinomicrobium weinanense]MBU3125650.1 GrpB family protein [Sinomicrobium weinanense]